MRERTTVLCILDGFGLNPDTRGNAIALAKKPCFDRLLRDCPNSTLTTHGESVGLPEGQMGNSEVGHLNIGAGRVVEQWLLRIGRALKGDFLDRSAAYQSFLAASAGSQTLHVIGLFSDGGVHSHLEHLKALLLRLPKRGGQRIALHLITDGRDTSPTQAQHTIKDLEQWLTQHDHIFIKSVCGRFFAMDRDKRWERTEKAYGAIAIGRADLVPCASRYVSESYQRNVTDEFLEPVVLEAGAFAEQDSLVFFNFREDRMRQIVDALCSPGFNAFERSAVRPARERVLCFTEYDHRFGLPFLFEQLEIKNHLGQVVSAQGLKQLRVAETEKYPHVTYFLNGGIEPPCLGEDRQIVPSPREVKTYDLKPEMSALGVCDRVVTAIKGGSYSLIVVNFANCDMVGHTGVLEAGIIAAETVDRCLARIVEALAASAGNLLVIADHGNAEFMINADGTPNTAHTTFPVPVVLYGMRGVTKLKSGGTLRDVAPTILKMMGISQPAEMSGTALF